MQICFLKGVNKPHTLRCVRKDGSQTYTQLPGDFRPQHDLAHFAVESVLGFKNSFFGLVSQGHDMEELAETRDRSWIPGEAQLTEVIVMTLQHERAGTVAPEDFVRMLAESCRGLNLSPPVLSEGVLEAMRREFGELVGRWNGLAPGETLELVFFEG